MFKSSLRPAAGPAVPAFSWWLILCLVGLDYFSTLAYLPSIAVEAAGSLAPLAAVVVVLVTLLLALPVYWYVVGRSPHGHGGVGLLETHLRGWSGKVLILVLLGFVATDFVITRTLSVADAATHVLANPAWRDLIESNPLRNSAAIPDYLSRYLNEQTLLTIALSLICFTLWAFLQGGFTRTFLRVASVIVVVYMTLTGLIIISGLMYLSDHRELVDRWYNTVSAQRWGTDLGSLKALAAQLFFILPQMVLGLSGFELTMASAPLVRGSEDDDPAQPRGRIRHTRWLMLAAALIMGTFIVGSIFVVTLLVPPQLLVGDETRPGTRLLAQHRALAYLAHGRHASESVQPLDSISPLFGELFGSIYDFSTIAILCLAGASSAIGIRDVVPHYLARYGMQLRWAQRTGMIVLLFNLVVLIVIVGFRASVTDQQWAYTTSVSVLLCAAAAAAVCDVSARWRGSWFRLFMVTPASLAFVFFFTIAGLTMLLHPSGLVIALAFVGVTVATAFQSRWVRSMELRFDGFTFADEQAKTRWQALCQLDFQVLVPHRPGSISLAEKEAEIRLRHRIGPEVPIILVEVLKGDPSDFLQAPLLQLTEGDGREVIRVSRCASIAHVIAAMGLAFREVGQPPEIHFGWSDEAPLAANLNFLLLGEGNVPWMVHALLRKAEPNPARRPRVVIG